MSEQRPIAGAALEVAPGVFVEASSLRFQFSRAGGPGGQNVNKLNTKAEVWVPLVALRGLPADAMERLRRLAGSALTHDQELHIAAGRYRTQLRNREDALERLRELLIAAKHRPKPRRKTRPSAGSRERRLEAKKQRGQIKGGRQWKGGEE